MTQRERHITFHGRMLTERYRLGARHRTFCDCATTLRTSERRSGLPNDPIRPYSPYLMTAISGPHLRGSGEAHHGSCGNAPDPGNTDAEILGHQQHRSPVDERGHKPHSSTARGERVARPAVYVTTPGHTTDQHHGLDTKGLHA